MTDVIAEADPDFSPVLSVILFICYFPKFEARGDKGLARFGQFIVEDALKDLRELNPHATDGKGHSRSAKLSCGCRWRPRVSRWHLSTESWERAGGRVLRSVLVLNGQARPKVGLGRHPLSLIV